MWGHKFLGASWNPPLMGFKHRCSWKALKLNDNGNCGCTWLVGLSCTYTCDLDRRIKVKHVQRSLIGDFAMNLHMNERGLLGRRAACRERLLVNELRSSGPYDPEWKLEPVIQHVASFESKHAESLPVRCWAPQYIYATGLHINLHSFCVIVVIVHSIIGHNS